MQKMRKEAAKNAEHEDKLSSLELLNQRQDKRAHLAIVLNPEVIKKDGQDGVMVGDKFFTMVKRRTRNFNTKTSSIGGSQNREILLLYPADQSLKDFYTILKENLPKSLDPTRILGLVKKLTQVCFRNKNTDSFTENHLKNNRVISLGDFINQKQGVCRHHALLNCYLISRLIEDGILQGEVIHHRQDFPGSRAQTWTLYYDHKSSKSIHSIPYGTT